MTEKWLPVPDYPGYEVSDMGNVRSLDRVVVFKDHTRRYRGRVLKPGLKRNRSNSQKVYHCVRLAGSTQKIARLVLLAHVGPPPFSGAHCRHLDDDSLNDALENLSWGTVRDNAIDKRRNGSILAGERCPAAKLTESDVLEIRTAATRGVLQREIAQRYGITQSNVCKIVLRKTWAHSEPGVAERNTQPPQEGEKK